MFIKFDKRLYNTRYITYFYFSTVTFDSEKPDSPIMYYEILMYHMVPTVTGHGGYVLHTESERYNVNEHYGYLKRVAYLEKLLCDQRGIG